MYNNNDNIINNNENINILFVMLGKTLVYVS